MCVNYTSVHGTERKMRDTYKFYAQKCLWDVCKGHVCIIIDRSGMTQLVCT